MTRNRCGRRGRPQVSAPSRLPHIPSAITSRYAALRREQNLAARHLAATEVERGVRPPATCRIAVARDRRTPFVWRPPRRSR